MAGYTPEPPESVWEGISEGLSGGRRRRRFLYLLAAAAGIALAITAGLQLILKQPLPEQVGITQTGRDDSAEVQVDSGTDEVRGETDAGTAGLSDAGSETSGGQEAVQREKPTRMERRVRQTMTQMAAAQDKPENVRVARMEPEVEQPVGNREEINTAIAQIKDSTESTITEGASRRLREVAQNEDSLLRIIQHTPEEAIEEPAKEKDGGKWQVGAALSPLISYRDAASADATQNMIVNSSESPRLTYAGGVQVSYRQSSRFTIESGVYYNKMGVNIGDFSGFIGAWMSGNMDYVERATKVVSISNSMGTVVSGNKETFLNNYQSDGGLVADYHMLEPAAMSVADAPVEGFSQSFEYLEIPLNLKYLLIDGVVDLQLIGGVSTNLLVNNSVSVVTSEGAVRIGEVTDVRNINYSGNAGIGIIYELFDRFSLSVEPRFRYYLNSINAEYLPATRPYSFGVYTGVNYLF